MGSSNDWIGFKVDLRDRYKKFALSVIALVRTLPSTVDSRVIADQLMKSGTSCYANYRAAMRGRSLELLKIVSHLRKTMTTK